MTLNSGTLTPKVQPAAQVLPRPTINAEIGPLSLDVAQWLTTLWDKCLIDWNGKTITLHDLVNAAISSPQIRGKVDPSKLKTDAGKLIAVLNILFGENNNITKALNMLDEKSRNTFALAATKTSSLSFDTLTNSQKRKEFLESQSAPLTETAQNNKSDPLSNVKTAYIPPDPESENHEIQSVTFTDSKAALKIAVLAGRVNPKTFDAYIKERDLVGAIA